MFTYSLCMIVKDEEAVLARCLDSYSKFFDEIIIVDTGSTDSTVEIASKYTDKLYDFEWIDDFSAARNYAFSKCTCDYIFSADADEYLDDNGRRQLAFLMKAMDEEVEIVQMKYVEESSSVLNTKKEYRPKLFKRQRTFKWQDPIHETVRLEPIVFDSDVEIIHAPVDSNHSSRDFQVFRKALSKDLGSSNMYLMYAKELYRCGEVSDYVDAREAFLDRVNMPGLDRMAFGMAKCILARGYRLEGRVVDFFENIMDAISLEISSAEICYEMGEHYFSKGDYEKAYDWYTAATANDPIIDIHYGGDYPLSKLADCMEKLDMREEMLFYRKKAEEWQIPEGD